MRWCWRPARRGRATRRGVDCLSLDRREGVERLRGTRWDAAVSLTAIPARCAIWCRRAFRSSCGRDMPKTSLPSNAWPIPPSATAGTASSWSASGSASAIGSGSGLAGRADGGAAERHRAGFRKPVSRCGCPGAGQAERSAAAGLYVHAVPGAGPAGRHVPADPPALPLRVFSDMGTYLTGPSDSQFQALYDQCRNTPGIEHVGTLAQPELAEALRAVSILAYPCTFPETGCIAALEAMAAGCAVVASDLGRPGGDDGGTRPAGRSRRGLEQLRCPLPDGAGPCHGVGAVAARHRTAVAAGTFRQRNGHLGERRAGEWAGFFKQRICLKVQNVAGCLNSETHLHKVAPLKQYPPAYGRNSPDTPRIKSPLQ